MLILDWHFTFCRTHHYCWCLVSKKWSKVTLKGYKPILMKAFFMFSILWPPTIDIKVSRIGPKWSTRNSNVVIGDPWHHKIDHSGPKKTLFIKPYSCAGDGWVDRHVKSAKWPFNDEFINPRSDLQYSQHYCSPVLD